MLSLNKWRILFVILVCLSGIYFLYPNFFNKTEVTALPNYLSKKQVNLGLDLQGGSHLLLEVDTKSVLKEKSEYLVDLIFKKLKSYKGKEIMLEKKILKKFIFSLFKEN